MEGLDFQRGIPHHMLFISQDQGDIDIDDLSAYKHVSEE